MSNPLTDNWTVFGRDQGQAVTVAYRYDAEADRIIRRVTQGKAEAWYDSTPCPTDVEWCGAEADLPSKIDSSWLPTSNPFAEGGAE